MNGLLVGLPCSTYVLLVLAFRARGEGWRASSVHAAVAWAGFAVLLTETLSLGAWLTWHALAIAWALASGGVLVYLIAIRGWTRCRHEPFGWGLAETTGLDWGDRGLLAAAAVLVCAVGVTALVSPPNTWDVRQYHMPRVVQWIQNQRVAAYPTHELKQIHMAPGAEYLALQLHALHGSDRFANVPQWLGFAGCALAVSAIAGLLGATPAAQVVAGLVAVTIPEGVLQASGANNDYVLAYFLAALIYYLLRFRRHPSATLATGVAMALALGCVTKVPMYVLAPPLVAAWWLACPAPIRRASLKVALLAVVVVLVVNGAQFSRNLALHGWPLGATHEGPIAGQFKYTSDRLSPGALVAGVVKNAALHLGTRDERINKGTTEWLERVIRAVGEEPSDPRTTWTSVSFRVPRTSRDETTAGNLAHLVLIVATVGYLAAGGWRRVGPEGVALALGLALAFVAFATVLKWQPWHVRLHLPLFVLWSPLIALALAPLRPRPLVWAAGALLVAQATEPALRNDLRPLVAYWREGFSEQSRERRYLFGLRHLEPSFVATRTLVERNGCRRVGLDLSARVGDQQEYAWLHVLGADRGARVVRAIGVTNRSAAYRVDPDGEPPCAVVCVFCTPGEAGVRPYAALGPAVAVSDDVVVVSARDAARAGR
jgi:hypothetical protein